MKSAGREKNGFLSSLSEQDFKALEPFLKTVDLAQDLTLVELGQPITHVMFPHTAVVALVVEFQTGERVEVALVGPDSILGVFGVMGEPVALITRSWCCPGRHRSWRPIGYAWRPSTANRCGNSWFDTARPCTFRRSKRRHATPCIQCTQGWRDGCCAYGTWAAATGSS